MSQGLGRKGGRANHVRRRQPFAAVHSVETGVGLVHLSPEDPVGRPLYEKLRQIGEFMLRNVPADHLARDAFWSEPDVDRSRGMNFMALDVDLTDGSGRSRADHLFVPNAEGGLIEADYRDSSGVIMLNDMRPRTVRALTVQGLVDELLQKADYVYQQITAEAELG